MPRRPPPPQRRNAPAKQVRRSRRISRPLARAGIREFTYSLHSPVCPACGESKFRGRSFCKKCYFRISDPLKRDALYARIGNGYERAFRDAMEALGCESMWLERTD